MSSSHPRRPEATRPRNPHEPEPGVLHEKIIAWYRDNARNLPWRDGKTTPWGVLVSEIMLQQTPVVRVRPVWERWMHRWPTPPALAAASQAEVLQAWDRLGYPRRALRLHQAAIAITEQHDGTVPATYDELIALPGIGDYTAAAVACFAFGTPETVVDTNIRRVEARAITGDALPRKSLTAAEMRLARELMPPNDDVANRWNAAVMELGALICTARSPHCDDCPVLEDCAWVAAGKPEADYVSKGQSWVGTDRQLRGAIMAVLRVQHSVSTDKIITTVKDTGRLGTHEPDDAQWQRCIDGLVRDGLAVSTDNGLALPQ